MSCANLFLKPVVSSNLLYILGMQATKKSGYLSFHVISK